MVKTKHINGPNNKVTKPKKKKTQRKKEIKLHQTDPTNV